MTDTRERPPPTTAPAAAIAATRPGRVVGLDGIRGLAALFVVPRPGALRVAVQVDRDVRAPTGLAHPAALLGRARIQSATGTPTFFVLAAILLPVTVRFARLFAAVFELPFQRHRGWSALRQAMSARLRQLRRAGPAAVAGRWRGASRASGPRNQAGGRCRPAHPQPVADRARPASWPGPPVPPDPGGSATRSGSC
jgi:hypothetical protein